jgi:hypothetical protein
MDIICGGSAMSRPNAGSGPGTTTGNPAISGVGSGMGDAEGSTVADGVQAGTVNDAAQGAGAAADPSLGSGMAMPERGDRMGDAATGGAPGMIAAAPLESFALPYKVIAAPGRDR